MGKAMSQNPITENLDDLLLDVATSIEPSDNDRKEIDGQYRALKKHLERPESPLSQYLKNFESRIYAQGSVSISGTIVSGDKDDRFDVDAMVEFEVPENWPTGKALDLLHEALQGFPDAVKIIRNTRCVTVHFANMHMDVTIMDPHQEPRRARTGEIFHSPQTGKGHRVPANPYGFSFWFRRTVFFQEGAGSFAERISKRRQENFVDRLQTQTAKAADQDKLPPAIPPRFDAQQVVALKLMKRILNVEYAKLSVRKPPSVYTTKKSADCGFEPLGLTAQLGRLARCIRTEMLNSLAVCSGPDERNPEYSEDRLNDRWPQTQEDRRTFANVMDKVLGALERAKAASFTDIAKITSELFGEGISTNAVRKHLTRRDGDRVASVVKKIGTIIPATVITSPAVAKDLKTIPNHNFHCEMKKRGDGDN
jgi:Second Messenger Oligonucleotide or Dinucleotide Synthetase domain